jgi:hypothetical protein
METMRTAEVLRRLGGAVALALVTGLAVALFARLAEAPVRDVRYVTPNEFRTESTGQLVTGHITDPRR